MRAAPAGRFHPKGGEILDVINEWNQRHPDQPFNLLGQGHGHGPVSR